MTIVQAQINKWLQIDQYKNELNQASQAELDNRFNQLIDFGTGGMRGVMAAGTNRMNPYTVRLATTGLAKQIIHDQKSKKVVISYDTRHHSKEFAKEAAETLLYYGIEAILFEEARPTPMLSFAVRYYEAAAGIMITASHNPKQYNGYKLYGEDGGQLTPEAVSFVRRVMEENLLEITEMPVARDKKPRMVLKEVEAAYLTKLTRLKSAKSPRDLSIVYTPLHGTGLVPIEKALNQFGYTNVYLEKAQAIQDGDFPTVQFPNPEEKVAFELAEKLGHEKNAQLLIATDPDADRLGVAVLHEGKYHYLTGNQLGALLLHYKLTLLKETDALKQNSVAIKTIVTSELGRKIAESFDITMEDTLTGFKYISEKIEAYDKLKEKTFVFGYEESYGYLLEDFVRDKDAIQAAVAVSEMAQNYSDTGRTLVDGLNDLYKIHGYYKEALISIELDPLSDTDEVAALMARFTDPSEEILKTFPLLAIENYSTSKKTSLDGKVTPLTLPEENVIKYELENESWICFRPSGTEPKIKMYLGVRAETDELARQQLASLEAGLTKLIK